MLFAFATLVGCETARVRPPSQEAIPEPAPQTQAAEPAPQATAPTQPSASLEDGEFAGLVAYTNWLRSRSADELKPLLADAEHRIRNNPRPIDRLRLAVLLSIPQAPFRDEARALTLAEEVIDSGASETALFAYTLRWDLQNRKALQADFDRAMTKERQQRSTLKKKLDELKAIEEQLHRRETTPLKPTP